MIEKVLPEGQAFASRKLRQGMTLMQINGIDVSSSSLQDALSLLKLQPRPMTTLWKIAPSRNLDGDSLSPLARRFAHLEPEERGAALRELQRRQRMRGPANSKVVVTFGANDNPLGLELAARRSGGVMIKRIVGEFSAAARSGKLRSSMSLLSVNDVDVSKDPLNSVLQRLSESARPLRTEWSIAPSRSLSPDGHPIRTEFNVIFQGPKELDMILHPAKDETLGLELAERRGRRGVLVKRVVQGGLIEKTYPGRLRTGMHLLRAGNEDLQFASLDEVKTCIKAIISPPATNPLPPAMPPSTRDVTEAKSHNAEGEEEDEEKQKEEKGERGGG